MLDDRMEQLLSWDTFHTWININACIGLIVFLFLREVLLNQIKPFGEKR